MDHFAGLDVSVKETSVCIVDDRGRIVREVKVVSEPEALLQVSGNPHLPLQADRTGSRAGRYRSGFSVRLPRQVCQWSVSKRGILKSLALCAGQREGNGTQPASDAIRFEVSDGSFATWSSPQHIRPCPLSPDSDQILQLS